MRFSKRDDATVFAQKKSHAFFPFALHLMSFSLKTKLINRKTMKFPRKLSAALKNVNRSPKKNCRICFYLLIGPHDTQYELLVIFCLQRFSCVGNEFSRLFSHTRLVVVAARHKSHRFATPYAPHFQT